jgi:hypothetical protein
MAMQIVAIGGELVKNAAKRIGVSAAVDGLSKSVEDKENKGPLAWILGIAGALLVLVMLFLMLVLFIVAIPFLIVATVIALIVALVMFVVSIILYPFQNIADTLSAATEVVGEAQDAIADFLHLPAWMSGISYSDLSEELNETEYAKFIGEKTSELIIGKAAEYLGATAEEAEEIRSFVGELSDEERKIVEYIGIELFGDEIIELFGADLDDAQMAELRAHFEEIKEKYADYDWSLIDEHISELVYGRNLTDEEIRQILTSLRASGADRKTIALVEWIANQVGAAYSQNLRMSDGIFDCSSLAYRAYQQIGVDLGANYAAGIAQNLALDRNRSSALNNLQPGDLIFTSTDNNGRYLNITHVAIYVGDGMIIDARGSSYGVVYRELPSYGSSFIGVGRPMQ